MYNYLVRLHETNPHYGDAVRYFLLSIDSFCHATGIDNWPVIGELCARLCTAVILADTDIEDMDRRYDPNMGL